MRKSTLEKVKNQMNSKKRISLVSLVLLSLTLGSVLSPIRPLIPPAAAAFASSVDLVQKPSGQPCPVGVGVGNSTVPSMSPGSTFTLCLRISDANDMDAWDVALHYYTSVLSAIDARYTTCGGYQFGRVPAFPEPDGVIGQVILGESYLTLTEVGFTGSCVLAEIDFQVDDTSAIQNPSTLIHITNFRANNVPIACVEGPPFQVQCRSGQMGHLQVVGEPLPTRVDIVKDAKYGGSSVRYVDLLDSPIRKRCIIENHHYRFDLSRDNVSQLMRFFCTLESFGNSYPVSAEVRLSIIDLTTNLQLPDIFSKESNGQFHVFTAAGQTAIVRVDKGITADDNSDGIRDILVGHNYLVQAQACYDANGDALEPPAFNLIEPCGPKARVFTFTVKA